MLHRLMVLESDEPQIAAPILSLVNVSTSSPMNGVTKVMSTYFQKICGAIHTLRSKTQYSKFYHTKKPSAYHQKLIYTSLCALGGF